MNFQLPTEKQEHIIRSIEFLAKTWRNTNDISSPTLFTDIPEEIRKYLYDGMNPEYNDRLIDAISELLKLILDADRHFESNI